MSSSLPHIMKMTIKGNIHSKFQNSFNIKISDYLVHVNAEENPVSSYGIKLEREKFNKIIESISVGDIVTIKSNVIFIYSSSGEIFQIDTRKLILIDLKIHQIELSDSRLKLILQELQGVNFKDNIGLPSDKLTKKKLSYLVNPNTGSKDLKNVAKYLIGRGLGLTPSGDDCLFGFFFILKLFNISDFTLDNFIYKYALKHTTDISIAYFRLLGMGYISEYYKSFSKAVKEENDNNLRDSIKKIIKIGCTSGHDGLLGIFLGTKRLFKKGNYIA